MANEQFKNLAQSTLSVAIGTGDTTITPAAVASFSSAPKFQALIGLVTNGVISNAEYIEVTAISSGNFTVTRGIDTNFPAVSHAVGEVIIQCLTSDLVASMFPNGGSMSSGGQISRYQSITEVTASAAIAILLPANPVLFKPYTIKDYGRNCPTNNFTITDPNSATIDGASSFVMKDFIGQSNEFWFNGTNWSVA